MITGNLASLSTYFFFKYLVQWMLIIFKRKPQLSIISFEFQVLLFTSKHNKSTHFLRYRTVDGPSAANTYENPSTWKNYELEQACSETKAESGSFNDKIFLSLIPISVHYLSRFSYCSNSSRMFSRKWLISATRCRFRCTSPSWIRAL